MSTIDPLAVRIVVGADSITSFVWRLEVYMMVDGQYTWAGLEQGSSGSLADACFLAQLAYIDVLNRR